MMIKCELFHVHYVTRHWCDTGAISSIPSSRNPAWNDYLLPQSIPLHDKANFDQVASCSRNAKSEEKLLEIAGSNIWSKRNYQNFQTSVVGEASGWSLESPGSLVVVMLWLLVCFLFGSSSIVKCARSSIMYGTPFCLSVYTTAQLWSSPYVFWLLLSRTNPEE